jgi:hypothetical protein
LAISGRCLMQSVWQLAPLLPCRGRNWSPTGWVRLKESPVPLLYSDIWSLFGDH